MAIANRNWRRRAGLAVAFAAPLALAGCAQLANFLPFLTQPDSRPGIPPSAEYKDPGGQFTIKYPADWKESPGTGKQVVLFEGTLKLPAEVALGVIVATVTAGVPEDVALNAYVKGYADEMKAQGETIFATASAKLGSENAQIVEHSIKVQGKEFKSRQTVAIKGDKAYQLNFLVSPPETFPVWVQTATAMADTFKILK
ncbi:MAG: hypothetical protein FJZ01_16215 [Candidatus Sericytochromatia bacterium]|nr:hypothetical protein [Candidatus Tanganyikabacteria bacterium]